MSRKKCVIEPINTCYGGGFFVEACFLWRCYRWWFWQESNKTQDIFICDNEVLAELFPYSALSHLAMPDFKCFHININNIVKFDLRILLSYMENHR